MRQCRPPTGAGCQTHRRGFLQYDPVTRQPEVVVEASSDPRKASDLARRFAKKLEAYTVLIIHHYNDNEHKYPVTVSCWTPGGRKILSKAEMSWSDFVQYMRHLHDCHVSYRSAQIEAA